MRFRLVRTGWLDRALAWLTVATISAATLFVALAVAWTYRTTLLPDVFRDFLHSEMEMLLQQKGYTRLLSDMKKLFTDVDAVYAINFEYHQRDYLIDPTTSLKDPLYRELLIYANPEQHDVVLHLEAKNNTPDPFNFSIFVNGLLLPNPVGNSSYFLNSVTVDITEQAATDIRSAGGDEALTNSGYATSLVLIQVLPRRTDVDEVAVASATPETIIANLQGWVLVRRKQSESEQPVSE
jgi:hypothetical protein